MSYKSARKFFQALAEDKPNEPLHARIVALGAGLLDLCDALEKESIDNRKRLSEILKAVQSVD